MWVPCPKLHSLELVLLKSWCSLSTIANFNWLVLILCMFHSQDYHMLPAKDQNFGRQNYPKSALGTTCCIIPGGKYICTGKANFRSITDQDQASASSHVGKTASSFQSQFPIGELGFLNIFGVGTWQSDIVQILSYTFFEWSPPWCIILTLFLTYHLEVILSGILFGT